MKIYSPGLRILILTLTSAFLAASSSAQEWPDWRGRNRDGIWKETGIIGRFTSNTIPLKWSIPCGPGYSGPTVAAGKVYLTDRIEKPEESERVLCVNADNGKIIWSYSYECPYGNVSYPNGPRASVVINDGKAYSLGTMGHLFCFEAQTGSVIWHHDLNSKYKIRMPTWGISATPLIFENKLIIQIGGSDGASVLALDKNTGKELWRATDDKISYSAPILTRQAGKPVVVIWTAENLNGLDPETGRVYWKIPFAVRMGMGISTPVRYGDYLFVSCFFSGSLLVKLSTETTSAEKVWLRAGESEYKTDALHCVINTPVIRDEFIYGVDSYGELRCLRLKTGDRVWEDLSAVNKNRWANIHLIEHGKQTWMFNEHGELLITELSPQGLKIISRARLIEPTTGQLNRNGTGVTWTHPAFANRHVFIRNDSRLVCAYLGEAGDTGLFSPK
ncbi:MAG TPA: PQQ-binding-like beta-propeller repeat protein [Bacteroidales bacterium]|nr:PQQ-binding-like beta-propeller repeat protein [Bacteroidales bacterium]